MNRFRDVSLIEIKNIESSFISHQDQVELLSAKQIVISNDSIDGQKFTPIRSLISPSKLLLFVVGMYGEIAIYKRISVQHEWVLQNKALIALDLFKGNTSGERNLSSIILSDNYDEHESEQYGFLTYTYYSDIQSAYIQGVGRIEISNEKSININNNLSTFHSWEPSRIIEAIYENDTSFYKIVNTPKYYCEYLMNCIDKFIPGEYVISFELFLNIQNSDLESTIIDSIEYSLFYDGSHHKIKPTVNKLDDNIYNVNCNFSIDTEKYIRLLDFFIGNYNNGGFDILGVKHIKIITNNYDYIGTNFTEIYTYLPTNSNPGGSHQITHGFIRDNLLYILQGDCFDEESVQLMDNYKGKIISMNFDGSNKNIVAKGLRNELTLFKFPTDWDTYGRVMGIGNGHNVGRLWLAPIPKPEDGIVSNFGWGAAGDSNIEEDGNGWQSFTYKLDPNNNIISPDGILKLFPNDPSPNGLEVIKINDRFIVIFSCFGKTNSEIPKDYEKSIWAAELINLGNQPSIINLQPLIKPDINNPLIPYPVTICYDHSTSTLIYNDISWFRDYPLIGEIKINNWEFILGKTTDSLETIESELLNVLKRFILKTLENH